MFRTFRFSVPATSKSLYELIGNEVDRCKGVLLQAPMTNAASVFIGEYGKEVVFIVNGGSIGVDITNIRDVFIKGTAPDALIAIIY